MKNKKGDISEKISSNKKLLFALLSVLLVVLFIGAWFVIPKVGTIAGRAIYADGQDELQYPDDVLMEEGFYYQEEEGQWIYDPYSESEFSGDSELDTIIVDEYGSYSYNDDDEKWEFQPHEFVTWPPVDFADEDDMSDEQLGGQNEPQYDADPEPQDYEPDGDFDQDGIPNKQDQDDDNDGIQDQKDANPWTYHGTYVPDSVKIFASDADGDEIINAFDVCGISGETGKVYIDGLCMGCPIGDLPECDGIVDEDDVDWIKSHPQTFWNTFAKKSFNRLINFINLMKENFEK